MKRPPTLLLALLLSASCRAPEGRVGIDDVSRELATRSGHGLRSKADEPWPLGVTLEDGLDESEAVALALWSSPDFARTLADLDLARADLVEAGLLKDPVLSFLFPAGPKQYEWTLNLPVEALWQRPRRVEIAQLDLERVAAEMVRSGLDLVLEVRTAFHEVLAARARVHLAAEESALLAELVKVTRARERAGDVGANEVEAVDLRRQRAGIGTRRLQHAMQMAGLRLQALVSVGLDPEIALVSGTETPPAIDGLTLDALLAIASAARPEVRAAELAVEATGLRAGLTTAEALRVSLLVDANEKGADGFEVGPGLTISIPLLDGGEGQRTRARALLEQTLRASHATAARVRAEVRADRAEVEARRSLVEEHRTRVAGPSAAWIEHRRQELELGSIGPPEWIEAQLSGLTTDREQVELELGWRRARARLERSLGCSLDRLPTPAVEDTP